MIKSVPKFLIASFLSFTVLFPSVAYAVDGVITRDQLNVDLSLSEQTQNKYAEPKKILIAQIQSDSTFIAEDPQSWIQLFYYYCITRLGFSDIPFHYIVDRRGNIYQGMSGGDYMVPYIDSNEGAILIAYFSDSSDITQSAQKALKSLVEDYSYKYGIAKSNVLAVDLQLKKREEGVPSVLKFSVSNSLFSQKVTDAVNVFTYSSERHITFTGEVTDLVYADKVNSGEKIKVDLKLKNNDKTPWYVDDNMFFLSKIKGKNSIFAENNVWPSFSKPLVLAKQVVPAGESIALTFNLNAANVLPGKYTEEFEFITMPNNPIAGTKISLTFEVLKGSRKIVKITDTGTGLLTVRECPRVTCKMVAAAKVGEKYLVLEEQGSWYKITVDDVQGWVGNQYAKEVQ